MAEDVLVSIPHETVNDDTVLILSWKVPSGSLVEKEQLICEIETSKAVLEIHAPAAGWLNYTRAAGEEAPVGATLCRITAAREMEAEPSTLLPGAQPVLASAIPARLSASAQLAAADYGIDAASFPPGTLVRREDVLRAAGKFSREKAKQPNLHVGNVPVTWIDLPRRKLAEGRVLRRGRARSLQSWVAAECDVTNLSAQLDTLGLGSIGIQAAIIFEAARLLRKYPVFNATYQRKRMGQYDQVNVGWALDAGQGLLAPVIREADTKSIREIGEIMQRQLDAYLESSLSALELTGTTFTVSDLSSQTVTLFQPLIPRQQAAILGISRASGRTATVLHLMLVFDHQLAEGRKAAEFLHDLTDRLQSHSVASAEPPPHCVMCHRDSNTLGRLKAVLLKSEVPPGFVCSLCVAGW